MSEWNRRWSSRVLCIPELGHDGDVAGVGQIRGGRVVVRKGHDADVGVHGWRRDPLVAFIARREYVGDCSFWLSMLFLTRHGLPVCSAHTTLVDPVNLALVLPQHIRFVSRDGTFVRTHAYEIETPVTRCDVVATGMINDLAIAVDVIGACISTRRSGA